jgi:methyl-accepting chemotaxis protein
MRYLKDLPIRGKLFAGFGAVLALTVILGVVLVSEMGKVNAGGVQIAATDLPSVMLIDRVTLDATDSRESVQSAMLSHSPAFIAHQLAAAAADNAEIGRLLPTYASMISNASDGRLYHQTQSQWQRYSDAMTAGRYIALAHQGTQAAESRLLASTEDEFARVQQAAAQWAKVNNAIAQEQASANRATYSGARTIGIALVIIAVLIGAAIAFLLSAMIKKMADLVLERLHSIGENCMTFINEGMTALSNGDLTNRYEAVTAEIPNPSKDELGRIAAAVNAVRDKVVSSLAHYNTTADRLSETIGQVAQTAGSVNHSSMEMASTSEESGRATGEIAHAISDVAEGAERQVRMIQDARLAAEEVARAVTESAENAQATAEVAAEARQAAYEGVGAADQANAAMESVRESSAAVSQAIGELAAKSEQIGAIVQTITGIAEQTNLLALNAAIEAARAGEQGRGFAVVAEEVRKLAEESQHAAREISSLIGAIQGETGKAVGVVQEGTERTREGVAVVEQTREAFVRIGAAVDDMTARVEQIAAVSSQISASASRMQERIGEAAAVAEQSSASTEEVSASTQETSASAQQIAASAQALSGSAEDLNRLVATFRIRD